LEINPNTKKEFKTIKKLLLNCQPFQNSDPPSFFIFSLISTPPTVKKDSPNDFKKIMEEKTYISSSIRTSKSHKESQNSIATLNIDYNNENFNFDLFPNENSFSIAKRVFAQFKISFNNKKIKTLSHIIQNKINLKINEMTGTPENSLIRIYETFDNATNSLVYGKCVIGQLKIELPNNKIEILKLTNYEDPEEVASDFVQKFNIKNKMFSTILNALKTLKENWEKNLLSEEEKTQMKPFDEKLLEKNKYFYFYYDHMKKTYKTIIRYNDDLQK
jgi:hypothetical protein